MPSAFVLINTESGAEDYVFNQIKRISAVKESYVSYGVYDLIVKVNADSLDELKEIVSYEIRSLDKVRATLTLMMAE
jgi:DNA-binding Lrp family transcriptional regulator